MPRNEVKPNLAWPSLARLVQLWQWKSQNCIKEDFHIKYRFWDHFCEDIIVNFPNVCLFEIGPGPAYGIAYIPKMVSPSSVLHTPLLTNNPSSPKSINTCSNESAGMRHVWSFVLSLKWNLSFLAGLGMTSFSGQFCTPYLPSNVSHSTTSWQSRKKKVERRQSTLMIEKVFPSPLQAQEGN